MFSISVANWAACRASVMILARSEADCSRVSRATTSDTPGPASEIGLERNHELTDGRGAVIVAAGGLLCKKRGEADAEAGRQDDPTVDQSPAQERPRPDEAARDRARRPAELFGGLLVGSSLEVAQDDRRPVLFGQVQQFVVEDPAQVPAFDLDERVGEGMVLFRKPAFARVVPACRPQGGERRFAAPMARGVGPGVQRQPMRDRAQPAPH